MKLKFPAETPEREREINTIKYFVKTK